MSTTRSYKDKLLHIIKVVMRSLV